MSTLGVVLILIFVSWAVLGLCAFLSNRAAMVKALRANEIHFLEENNRVLLRELDYEREEKKHEPELYRVPEEEKSLVTPNHDLTVLINRAVKEYNSEHPGANVEELDS